MTQISSDQREAYLSFDQTPIVGKRGVVAAKLAFRTVVFFENGNDLDVQATAYAALADYADLVAPHLVAMQLPGENARPQAFDAGTFRERGSEIIRNTKAQDVNASLNTALLGAPFETQTGGVSQFGGSVVAMGPEISGDADVSFIEVSTPIGWDLASAFANQIELLKSFCQRLPFLHGFGGLGLQLDRIMRSTSSEAETFAAIQRFPGLDPNLESSFASEISIRRPTADQFMSINWLTAINAPMAEAVGGETGLRAALGATNPVTVLTNGVLCQAGELPQLGDTNRGIPLSTYRAVSNALKSLRFEDYQVGIFPVEAPLDSLEETLKWVRRFD